MAVTVRIPPALRSLTEGKDEVAVEPGTVAALVDALDGAHPGLKDRICDERGVRRFVNVFVEDEDIRFLDGLDTVVEDDCTVSIIPAIAGGR